MSGEANIWNPRTLIEVSADTKAIEEKITAIADQTLFTLKTFAYSVGTGALEVHRNGLLLTKNTDWVEQTSQTFSLVKPSTVADLIVATGHIAITGDVDVRDTDIFINNYQGIRDYAGIEITLYSQGQVTVGDTGENFFQKITGAGVGFYIDNDDTVLVPTGGDGSIGWVRRSSPIKHFDTVAEAAAAKSIRINDTIVIGERANALFKAVLASGVTPNTFNIIQSTGVVTLALELEAQSILNIQEWGWIGDNTTSDADVYLAAIDFLETLGGGEIITPFTSTGVYLAKSISFKDNITFNGGKNFFNTKAAGSYDTSGALIMAGYLSAETETTVAVNCKIINCKYSGLLDNSTTRPFYLGFCQDSFIEKSAVSDSANAFFVRRGDGNTVRDCNTDDIAFQSVATGGADSAADRTGSLLIEGMVCRNNDNMTFDVRTLSTVIIKNNRAVGQVAFVKNQGEGRFIVEGNYCELSTSSTSGFFGIKVDSSDCIIADNIIISEGNAAVITVDADADGLILTDNIITADAALFGAIRVNSNINLSNFIMTGNKIKTISNTNYTMRAELTATLTNCNISDNIIEQGAIQNGTGDRSAVRIENISDSQITNNIIIVNTDGAQPDNKGLWMIGTVDRVNVRGNTIKVEEGTGDNIAIDMRGANVTNCRIDMNTVDGVGLQVNMIQIQAGNNNIEFYNTVNGVHEQLTPTVIV